MPKARVSIYHSASYFHIFVRSHQTSWSLPLQNATWHSGTWPSTMTPSIDQTLHQFANLLPNWTLIPILTLLPNFGGFHRTLQRVRLANRGCLLLRTPRPVPFGTCICSNVETILSWTCHVYGPFEFRTSLGTSILLRQLLLQNRLIDLLILSRDDVLNGLYKCSRFSPRSAQVRIQVGIKLCH